MSRGAKILAALLVLAVAASAAWLLLVPKDAPTGAVARITQNGELLEEIPLEEVEEPYSFTITGEKRGGEHGVGGTGPHLHLPRLLSRPGVCEPGVDLQRGGAHCVPAQRHRH